MTIQTFGDLQAAVADYSNRTDLATQIPDFINAAHIKLQEYVGPLAGLKLLTDTNSLLQYDPYVYLWGALVELASYMRDDALKQDYEAKYVERLADLATTGFSTLQVRPITFIPRPTYGYGCARWPD